MIYQNDASIILYSYKGKKDPYIIFPKEGTA